MLYYGLMNAITYEEAKTEDPDLQNSIKSKFQKNKNHLFLQKFKSNSSEINEKELL